MYDSIFLKVENMVLDNLPQDKLERIANALEKIAANFDKLLQLKEKELEEFDDLIDEATCESVATQEDNILAEIRVASEGELTNQLVAFAKQEFPEDGRIWMYKVSELFRLKKGIPSVLPPEISIKLKMVELLAEKTLDAEQKRKHTIRLDQETLELPKLILSCLGWANEHGFKRVTQSDIRAFLVENNIELLKEIENLIYAKVNVMLKSKK